MDPIETIKPYKDSTVAMIRAAHPRGIRCFYMGVDDVFVEGTGVKAIAREIELKDDPYLWCALGRPEVRSLTDFDAILMRKDPPVDKRFLHACYMLEQAARQGARVINSPEALIAFNEKLFAAHFPEFCPATLVASDKGILHDFLLKHGKIIIKPLDGMGGDGVFMVAKDDVNFDVIWEIQTQRGTYPVMAQEFLPSISDGDKRVIVINGVSFDHVLVRSPRSGSIRGNMAAGGTTSVRKITDTERHICDTVGKVLKEKGILFAGLDIIGDRLIEINITSPTGLVQISKECGIDVADLLVEEILGR